MKRDILFGPNFMPQKALKMNQTEMKWRSRCGKSIVIVCGRAL